MCQSDNDQQNSIHSGQHDDNASDWRRHRRDTSHDSCSPALTRTQALQSTSHQTSIHSQPKIGHVYGFPPELYALSAFPLSPTQPTATPGTISYCPSDAGTPTQSDHYDSDTKKPDEESSGPLLYNDVARPYYNRPEGSPSLWLINAATQEMKQEEIENKRGTAEQAETGVIGDLPPAYYQRQDLRGKPDSGISAPAVPARRSG